MTDFATSIERLLNQVRHWEAPRWRAEGRGDRVYALVQRLADLGADAEGRPRRTVPRESDLVLPDQLRVVADDLLAAGGGDDAALAEVDAVRQSL
ncbi:hypothetical protein [Actinoplanes sp. NPDC048796]|uniref:hypothetical protein n=1 Tax=unclassified Actinoplanes TaxID=2626549 RepID=UPI0033F234E2